MVDPTFNFQSETRAEWRVRQRDDLYPHEIFEVPPYDGILVSKSMVDGNDSAGSRYSLAQRLRFWRSGVREFFRSAAAGDTLQTMGDCGAFSYVNEMTPPVTPDEVIEFYETCEFDFGISVDHVILGFQSKGEEGRHDADTLAEWTRRQEITLELADEFQQLCKARNVRFTPIGVAQGWSPESYAFSVSRLQEMGYQRVALGGMVPLKTLAILECLEEIQDIRRPETLLHLLGVGRYEYMTRFQDLGVASFDTTSPLRQAFKDGKDNYYTPNRTYMAVRVPQVEGNPKLLARIRSGELNQDEVRRLETLCLKGLEEYDRGQVPVESVLERLLEYENVHHPKENRSTGYREVLEDRPWDACPCEVCRKIGIHVIIFRGAERNKRRGFHNLSVFYSNLRKEFSHPRR